MLSLELLKDHWNKEVVNKLLYVLQRNTTSRLEYSAHSNHLPVYHALDINMNLKYNIVNFRSLLHY